MSNRDEKAEGKKMTGRQNRRDIVIETADRLLVRQGYHATSMRQIAREADCTVAAIYYHFKSGKRELMHTILKSHTLDLKGALQECEGEHTLEETIRCFAEQLTARAATDLKHWCWLAAEHSQLNAGERAIVREQFSELHNELTTCLHPFVRNEEDVQQTAWMILAAMLGYTQLSVLLGPDSIVSLKPAGYTAMIGPLLTRFFLLE